MKQKCSINHSGIIATFIHKHIFVAHIKWKDFVNGKERSGGDGRFMVKVNIQRHLVT